MADFPGDGGRGTDDIARAPAPVTQGLTPDPASPAAPNGPPDEVVEPARRGFLVRLVTEPMWVLGLVLFMDEVDKNVVRGMITPLKEEFDRWNRSKAIGKTVVGWSVLTAGGAASVGFPMLVGMRSALGFGQAITEPSAASLVGDYYPPDQRGRAFSVQQVMLLAGTGVGVGLGGFIGTRYGWRPALVVLALPGLLVAMLVLRLRGPRRGTADMMAALDAVRARLDDTFNPIA